GLRVRQSTVPIAGYGLFATAKMPQGETVDVYAGKVAAFVNDAEGDYLISVKDVHTIDARARQSCIARYINHSDHNANCRFVYFESPGKHMHVIVQTIHDVQKDEELFVDYGPL
ncbi:hypothetical protein JKP88DRAFT_154599, partial [Tribonema minus]